MALGLVFVAVAGGKCSPGFASASLGGVAGARASGELKLAAARANWAFANSSLVALASAVAPGLG